jgi:hypothetical protein
MFVLFPVVTIALGAWLADETVTKEAVTGAALVMLGVWFGALSPSPRRLATRPAAGNREPVDAFEHHTTMTSRPGVCPVWSWRRASGASLSGNLRSTTGVTLPASMSSLSVSRSAALSFATNVPSF